MTTGVPGAPEEGECGVGAREVFRPAHCPLPSLRGGCGLLGRPCAPPPPRIACAQRARLRRRYRSCVRSPFPRLLAVSAPRLSSSFVCPDDSVARAGTQKVGERAAQRVVKAFIVTTRTHVRERAGSAPAGASPRAVGTVRGRVSAGFDWCCGGSGPNMQSLAFAPGSVHARCIVKHFIIAAI